MTPTPSLAGASEADRVQEALLSVLDRRVNGQVWLAALQICDERRQQPEWLWYDDERTSFGRWSRTPRQAPYIRADIAAASVASLLADLAALRTRAETERANREQWVAQAHEFATAADRLAREKDVLEARVAQLEADKARLEAALGCHLNADAYRESFPDNDQDAAHDRKSETWWRLMARCAVPQDDPLHEACSVAALSIPEVVAHRDAVIAKVTQEHGV